MIPGFFSVVVILICAMALFPNATTTDGQHASLDVMQDVSSPVVIEPVEAEELPADDVTPEPPIADDNSYAVQPNGDATKAWDQEGRGTDDTHLDAWNQGNIDGHAESDPWFYDEPGYVDEMLRKAISYDSDTDWAVTVDTDLCRATFFHREGGRWVAECGWNSYQGLRRPWQDSEYDGMDSSTKRQWSGPRSRSFKGAWKIVGRWPDGGGVSEWATCIVSCNHEMGAVGQDGCQRIEVGYGDATNTPLEKRFKTTGCTGLDEANAKWVCETIPNSTTVVVFDSVNPWPDWFQGDSSPS